MLMAAMVNSATTAAAAAYPGVAFSAAPAVGLSAAEQRYEKPY
jgi:hypothetical protein